MTALDHRPAQLPLPTRTTQQDVAAYVPTAQAYARAHPGNGDGAVRAGIDAVLANRERHPQPVQVHAGMRMADSLAEVVAAAREGWEPVGSSTLADSGLTVYWLDRAERPSGGPR